LPVSNAPFTSGLETVLPSQTIGAHGTALPPGSSPVHRKTGSLFERFVTPEGTHVTSFSPDEASKDFATAGLPAVSLVVVPLVAVVLDDELPPEPPPPQAARESTHAAAIAAKRKVRRPLIQAKNMRLAEPVLRVLRYLKMLTARAATSSTVAAETDDSTSIITFARRVSGIASVGLNAIAFVNEM